MPEHKIYKSVYIHYIHTLLYYKSMIWRFEVITHFYSSFLPSTNIQNDLLAGERQRTHLGSVWYICLKIKNYCLKIFMKRYKILFKNWKWLFENTSQTPLESQRTCLASQFFLINFLIGC